jgi:hypothetical protein
LEFEMSRQYRGFRGVGGGYQREDDEAPLRGSRRMTARYAGKCIDTGRPIQVGDTIDYHAGSGAVLVQSATADSGGKYVSDVIRTSGGTFYRNKAGRCEDAPCCGCCTI